QAPLIARDKAPFCWQFLDKPADGTVLMTWQPLQRLANNCATDGYIWAPPEQLYKHDLGNGLVCSDTRCRLPKRLWTMLMRRYRFSRFTTSRPALLHPRSSLRRTLGADSVWSPPLATRTRRSPTRTCSSS